MKHGEILELARTLGLPGGDADTIAEYLAHNAWGLALKDLCSAIKQERRPIAQEQCRETSSIGEIFGRDPELWEALRS